MDEYSVVETTRVSVPTVSHGCRILTPPPQETLQDQQVALAQAPMRSLPSPWVLVQDTVCMLKEWSPCFTQSPTGLQSQMVWGLLLIVLDL